MINIDWLFMGKNCEEFLNILVSMGRLSNIKTKSIRCVIDLLWNEYQPRIVEQIFLKYCFYLTLQITLSTGLAAQYYKILELSEEEQVNYAARKLLIGTMINFMTIGALYLWYFFFWVETKKFFRNPELYMMDYSNWLDMFSQCLSLSFFCVLDYTIIFDTILFKIEAMRIWGGAACMLMWIRMFQWMRLFNGTAHFITLLSEVMNGLSTFNLMWLIVMAAFGNFFYVMNQNTPKVNDNHWVGVYF